MPHLLEDSLKSVPIIQRGEYHYFIHPITDGVPYLEPGLLKEVADRIVAVTEPGFDKIVTVEAMGIHIGTAIAIDTGIPLSIIRKRPYHLPGEIEIDQSTGYSKGKLFLNGISQRDHIIIVDDVISSGGTLKAVCSAVKGIGAVIVDIIAVFERGDGAGELRRAGYPVKTLIKLEVNSKGVTIL